jgi:hypothetical protein
MRTGRGVTVALPYGTTKLCPIRALRSWQAAAGIAACTVARIIQARAARAGFDAKVLGGHSLKRGALSTGMDRNIHPTRLKQLGCHKTYAVLDEYLELRDPFEGHPLNGSCDRSRTALAESCAGVREARDHSPVHAAIESHDPGTKSAPARTSVC